MTSSRNNAFTLIELMVVVSLIVLMLLLALPAVNFITGARSVESATNVINSILGTARSQAIASQSQVGVLFFWDKTREQTVAAICALPSAWDSSATYVAGDVVEYPANSKTFYILPQGSSVVGGTPPSTVPSPTSPWVSATGYRTNIFMPVLADNFDLLPLPKGVGVQGLVIPDTSLDTNLNVYDRYVSVACILFDGDGRLQFTPYGIYAGLGGGNSTRLGAMVQGNNVPQSAPLSPVINNDMGQTQAALVLFDHQEFKDAGYDEKDYLSGDYGQPLRDRMYTDAPGERNEGTNPPQGEEIALNGVESTGSGQVTPLRTVFLLINRYNGTILKTD